MSKHDRCSPIHGFSLVGMLVTMVCILVLFVVLMNSINKATTGQGSAVQGTVRSFEDQMQLASLGQVMVASAQDNRGRYITPSEMTATKDVGLNTTANLMSAMVMNHYATCKLLMSANEYSPYVLEKTDYDYEAYNPTTRVMWDTTFEADLSNISNTSYAHMPLCGERFDKQWKTTMDGKVPLVGNRGPKDGVHDPNSWSYGRNGQWGGHIVFGDGHVEFTNSFALPGLSVKTKEGQMVPDNVFNMETGAKGSDGILSFTKKMTKDGVELQFD
jgi:prepilin-type processing-associated H-X9-DG protein